jgi:hypothetical protein
LKQATVTWSRNVGSRGGRRFWLLEQILGTLEEVLGRFFASHRRVDLDFKDKSLKMRRNRLWTEGFEKDVYRRG